MWSFKTCFRVFSVDLGCNNCKQPTLYSTSLRFSLNTSRSHQHPTSLTQDFSSVSKQHASSSTSALKTMVHILGDTTCMHTFRILLGFVSMGDSHPTYNKRRAKINVETPAIPLEFRVEKALEAIYICCFGKDPIEEEDEELLRVMLKSVFPSVAQVEINRIISEKAKRVAEGSDGNNFPEPKPLSKDAVQLQMKDLQFLRQNSET